MQRQGGAFPNSAGREHESPERHPRPFRSVPPRAPRPGPGQERDKRDPHHPRTWQAGAERRGRTPPLLCAGPTPPSPRLTRVGRSRRRVAHRTPVGRFTSLRSHSDPQSAACGRGQGGARGPARAARCGIRPLSCAGGSADRHALAWGGAGIGCSDPQNARSETTCTPNLGKGVADGGVRGGLRGRVGLPRDQNMTFLLRRAARANSQATPRLHQPLGTTPAS